MKRGFIVAVKEEVNHVDEIAGCPVHYCGVGKLNAAIGAGELINKGFTEGALADEGKRQGMMSLRQDAIVKLLEGKVSVEEVLKETV